MKKFIKSQIDSFNKKTYKKYDLLKSNLLENAPMLFKIEIKNNKMIYDKKLVENDFINRKKQIINILQKMLDKYKIQNTILILTNVDGYFWKEDIPVFNFAVPTGCQGLIFPNFDIYDFLIDSTEYNYDQMKNLIQQYPIEKIKSDLFFRGGQTSKNKTKIREKLQKKYVPFNVKLNQHEFIGNFKKHKYLLDLPGVKPWSVRLKYLLIMNSLIFRISFYDSNTGEKDFYQQSFDYLF